INLLEVGDTGTALTGGAGLHEVGNRDRSQQTDDGHHDHDFNEGEPSFATLHYLHSLSFRVGVKEEKTSVCLLRIGCSRIAFYHPVALKSTVYATELQANYSLDQSDRAKPNLLKIVLSANLARLTKPKSNFEGLTRDRSSNAKRVRAMAR